MHSTYEKLLSIRLSAEVSKSETTEFPKGKSAMTVKRRVIFL
jgi:hypothetical protein